MYIIVFYVILTVFYYLVHFITEKYLLDDFAIRGKSWPIVLCLQFQQTAVAYVIVYLLLLSLRAMGVWEKYCTKLIRMSVEECFTMTGLWSILCLIEIIRGRITGKSVKKTTKNNNISASAAA